MLQRWKSCWGGLGLSHPPSPMESWEDEGGLTALRLLHHEPCLILALPGENFLLEMAGFPMPILGVRGSTVVSGAWGFERGGDSLERGEAL